jgi:tetratricopeptide (TPR) repeat protein
MKRKIIIILGSIFVVSVCYIVWGPSLTQRAGNFFFGGSPTFYNVDIAQFFFKQSSYPLWGETTEYAHYQLSRTYFIEGELDTALYEAQKELEVYPENFRTYYILGLTLGYMHREREAIDAFQKFIEFKPESWAARNDKAWLHFRIGDVDGGLETIVPAVDQNPYNPWVMNTYGVLLMNKERYEEARGAFISAKRSADSMTEEVWGIAYPGNSPEIYGKGLVAMRASIQANLEEVESRLLIGADN